MCNACRYSARSPPHPWVRSQRPCFPPGGHGNCQAQSHFTMSALASAYRVNRTSVLRFIPCFRLAATGVTRWTFFKSYSVLNSAKLLGHECRSARSLPAPKFVLGRAHGVTVRSRVSAWWPRVTSPSISAVAGDRLSLSHTRPSYLDTSAAPLGVFPRPNSSLGAPTGLQSEAVFPPGGHG